MKTYKATYLIEADSEGEAEEKVKEVSREVLIDSMIVEENKEKTIADRKFIEDVIDLHEQDKDIEQIMFSLNMVYEK